MRDLPNFTVGGISGSTDDYHDGVEKACLMYDPRFCILQNSGDPGSGSGMTSV
ncbi:MAG: hypothetical protein R3Y39_03340 [Rikenellaceae bacterium]